MCWNDRGGVQIGRLLGGAAVHLLAHPGSAHQHLRLRLNGAGEIDDAASGALRVLPVLAGESGVSAEKGEVYMVKGIGLDALDEGDFVAYGFKLAQRFFIVHEKE